MLSTIHPYNSVKSPQCSTIFQSSSSKSSTLKVGWDMSAWGGGEGVGGATTTAGGRSPGAT